MNIYTAQSLSLSAYTVRSATSTRSIPLRTRKSSLRSSRLPVLLQTPRCSVFDPLSKVIERRRSRQRTKELKELLLPLCRKMLIPILMPHPLLYHIFLLFPLQKRPSSAIIDWGLSSLSIERKGGEVAAAEVGKRLLFNAISLAFKKIMLKKPSRKKTIIKSLVLRCTYTFSAMFFLLLLLISHVKHL